MKLRKSLAWLVMHAAAFVTPGFSQVYWGNQSPAGISDDIWCVTYANSTYAAVTSQGKLLTSSDGLTWSSQTIDQGIWLVSIAYGNGTWVAVGAAGTVLVSTDLKTWVTAKAATSNKLNGVLYYGGVWAAVGDSATVITSTDALNWTVQTVPADVTGFLHGITTGAASTEFGFTAPADFYISGAVAGNGTGSVITGVILEMSGTPTTTGGKTYAISFNSVGTAGNLEAISDQNNATVAVGWGTVASGYQFNVQPRAVPNVIYRGLAYGNGYWVVAGEQGTLLSSTDDVTWTQRFSGDSPTTLSTSTLLSAAYSSVLQRFVVTGTGGTILVSSSPPTVFANVSTRGYVSNTQTFIGGFYIAGTGPRTVLIRGDGPVLGAFGVANPLPDPVLTVFNSNGAVIASNTGWTTNTKPATVSTAALEVGAFALPSPSPDSALLLTLAPGAYTAQITSASGASGIALFEAYTD